MSLTLIQTTLIAISTTLITALLFVYRAHCIRYRSSIELHRQLKSMCNSIKAHYVRNLNQLNYNKVENSALWKGFQQLSSNQINRMEFETKRLETTVQKSGHLLTEIGFDGFENLILKIRNFNNTLKSEDWSNNHNDQQDIYKAAAIEKEMRYLADRLIIIHDFSDNLSSYFRDVLPEHLRTENKGANQKKSILKQFWVALRLPGYSLLASNLENPTSSEPKTGFWWKLGFMALFFISLWTVFRWFPVPDILDKCNNGGEFHFTNCGFPIPFRIESLNEWQLFGLAVTFVQVVIVFLCESIRQDIKNIILLFDRVLGTNLFLLLTDFSPIDASQLKLDIPEDV